MNTPATATVNETAEKPEKRPQARWVILAAVAIAVLPPLVLEWNREPARWLAADAANDTERHAFQSALDKLNRALEKDPGNELFYLHRASLRLRWADQTRPWRRREGEPAPSESQRQQLLRQAREDIDRVLTAESGRAVRTLAGEIYLRLGDGAAAVQLWADAAQTPQRIRPEQLLNQYAYMRACADLELEKGLEQANSALEFLQEPSETRTAVIDTRGYLYYRLGRYEEALEDFNEAVEGFREQSYEPWVNEGKAAAAGRMSETELMQRDTMVREAFATLLYHRMLTYEAMGNGEAAQQDLEQLKELLPGYDRHELW